MEILFESSRLARLSGINEEVDANDRGQFAADHPDLGLVTIHWASDDAFTAAIEQNNKPAAEGGSGGSTDALLQTAAYVTYQDEKYTAGSDGFKAVLDDANVSKLEYGGAIESQEPVGLEAEAAELRHKRALEQAAEFEAAAAARRRR